MFWLFVDEVVSESFLLFSEFAYLKVCFFGGSDEFHVDVAGFVFFFLAVLFKFSDLQFVLLVVVEVVAFEVLDLEVVLVLEFAQLHVLHVLDVRDFFLQFLDFVK